MNNREIFYEFVSKSRKEQKELSRPLVWIYKGFQEKLYTLIKGLNNVTKFRCLEVGCGHGFHIAGLAPYTKEFIGLDISEGELKKAAINTKNLDNVSFKKGDVENLPFENSSFDLVLCSELIEHLLTPNKALDEMRRVLKK